MSLNFVSTSVLTSEDGIAYSTETAIPSEEAQANRLKQQSSNGKSLYEQLEERKLLKEEEYNNNTKLIFAPPRALDEEDVEFFEDLNENKNRELLMRKEKERRELELFRQAQKKDVSSSANSVEKIGNGNSYASTNTSMYKISVPEKKQDNAPVVNIVRGILLLQLSLFC